MPSGGLLVRARYSWRRRRWAVDDAIVIDKLTSQEAGGPVVNKVESGGVVGFGTEGRVLSRF